MSDLVERLKQRYEREVLNSFPWNTLGDDGHIKWWINAIADELEREGDRVYTKYPDAFDSTSPGMGVPAGTHSPITYLAISQWLRPKASS